MHDLNKMKFIYLLQIYYILELLIYVSFLLICTKITLVWHLKLHKFTSFPTFVFVGFEMLYTCIQVKPS